MRRILALALFTLVALAPTAGAQAPASSPSQADPAEEVRQMQKRFADAISAATPRRSRRSGPMTTRSRTAPGSS